MKGVFPARVTLICTILCLCRGLSPAFGQLTPITLTSDSYTHDLIAESGSNPEAVTTAAIDGSAYNILYTKGFQAANSAVLTSGGLPDNGILYNAAGDSWQLHSYASNNALFFPAQSAVSTGSLSLHTPAPYWRLSILAAAGYGPTTVTITLKFTDSSATNYGDFNILDWFENTPYVVDSLGRILRQPTVADNNATPSDPRLYQTVIILNTTDQAKTLARVIIRNNSTNNLSTAAFFALSGVPTSALALNTIHLDGHYQASTNSIGLLWDVPGTASNTVQYDIQRATDAVHFVTVASKIAPVGSDPANNNWSDNATTPGQSYYYRILETDPMGEQVYSNTIHIQVPAPGPGFSVVPSADLLYVNTGSLPQPVQYAIYNIAGQELLRGAATAGNRFAVNIHTLSRGIYFIRLQSPDANRSIEFLR